MSRTLFEEDNFLMLSGIQHIAFCERQWALIHLEQQWEENVRTVEGRHFHEKADDPFIVETRGDQLISRSVPLLSYHLALYGVADVVEWYRVQESNNGIDLKGHDGIWQPKPVEYKRGIPKKDDRDKVQLCAQAICLEEMLHIHIESGDLYYGQTRRREHVVFNMDLRDRVKSLASRMHILYQEGVTPQARQGPHCKLCSLANICLPKIARKSGSVSRYVKKYIRDIVETV